MLEMIIVISSLVLIGVLYFFNKKDDGKIPFSENIRNS